MKFNKLYLFNATRLELSFEISPHFYNSYDTLCCKPYSTPVGINPHYNAGLFPASQQ